METQTTPKSSRMRLIAHFLRGSLRMFLVALVFSMLNTAFNALTPMIIRTTVDSVIGGEPYALPDWLIRFLGLDGRTGVVSALLLAAAAVMIVSALSGVCNYVSRMQTAKGSETFIKSLRDRLYEHIQKLPFAWHTKHQTGEIIQ